MGRDPEPDLGAQRGGAWTPGTPQEPPQLQESSGQWHWGSHGSRGEVGKVPCRAGGLYLLSLTHQMTGHVSRPQTPDSPRGLVTGPGRPLLLGDL